MKILFSDNSLWALLIFRRAIITFLLEKGHTVVLVAPQDHHSDLSDIPPKAKYIPVPLARTGSNPWADYKFYRTLKKIYRDEHPDYIFHYTIKPNIYGTLAAHSLDIRSSAMIAGLGYVYLQKGLKNTIAQIMYKYALRYTEKVIVLNKSNLNTLLERKVTDSEKLLWFRGGEGVDLSKFSYRPLPGASKPVFLMICRLLYDKGYAEYTAAARALKERAEFRIMGPLDDHPSAVKQETIEADVANKVIKYMGYSSDVIPEIKKADCIVLPSYGEGLSRVLMEGLAMGRPVITTDIPGCRETISDSVNGYICQPKDSDSLIKACEKFINLTVAQREEMGKQSRLLAEKFFDQEKVIESYLSLLFAGKEN